jgi:hypothetical protein
MDGIFFADIHMYNIKVSTRFACEVVDLGEGAAAQGDAQGGCYFVGREIFNNEAALSKAVRDLLLDQYPTYRIAGRTNNEDVIVFGGHGHGGR